MMFIHLVVSSRQSAVQTQFLEQSKILLSIINYQFSIIIASTLILKELTLNAGIFL